MRIVMFYHSLVSDWNHGNAHFLRGIVAELLKRGHEVCVFEPVNGWSLRNVLNDAGTGAIAEFRNAYPHLDSRLYDAAAFDFERELAGADLVIVHEWNSPQVVRRVGEAKRHCGYRLLFHDTHHRAVSDSSSMAAYDLTEYDGVLAFGSVIRDIYLDRGWAGRAWTWHEAADTSIFQPRPNPSGRRDLVWIGNWGDDERTLEIREFLIKPVCQVGARAAVYGVRYPPEAIEALYSAGITYHGWLPNFRVPEVFSQFAVTVHIPRAPYRDSLPGIPTIRVFEALACGIPLVSAPWDDVENLFSPNHDFLVARNGREMERHLRDVLNDPQLATSLSQRGLETILARHTCVCRVDELMGICRELGLRQESLPVFAEML